MSSVFFRKGDRGPAVAEIRARLARLGVLSGSRHVRAEQSLRTLMYPADGGPDDTDPSQWETTALASGEFDYEEPHSGIPRMSSIPVYVEVVQRPSRSQP